MAELVSARSTGPDDEAAEALALTALAFLLEDTDRTNRFLAATGMDGTVLPACLGDPAFLGCVLDFIIADEALLLAVAESSGLRPDRVVRQRQRLPGALPLG